MGCPGIAKRDPPIHTRKANQLAGVITIRDECPIGYKSHLVHQFHFHDRQLGRDSGILLITRDPAHAIGSHVYRVLRRNLVVTDRTIRTKVVAALDDYLALIHLYRSMRQRFRVHVKFENLIHPDVRVASVQALLNAAGVDAKVGTSDLDAILATAKNSQQSVGNYRPKLMNRIKRAVSNRTTYDEVLELLEECTQTQELASPALPATRGAGKAA